MYLIELPLNSLRISDSILMLTSFALLSTLRNLNIDPNLYGNINTYEYNFKIIFL